MEKFTSYDLNALSTALAQTDLDLFQASELVAAFLNGRGYGANARAVQDATIRMADDTQEPEQIQAELERVALVM